MRLSLPVLQNWDCHNCGGCCRQHQIEITEAEYQRIADQKWTAADGVADGGLVRERHWSGKSSYRLAHQSDGACAFLTEKGLCRIHAKFGEAAKPLACRVYPYAFHPAGKSVAVSLRFSCPSVVKNAGRSMTQQISEIRSLADAVVPSRAASIPPPKLNAVEQVDWPDFLKFVEALYATFQQPDIPLSMRLLQGFVWTSLVAQATFSKLRGDRIHEFLELVQQAARDEISNLPAIPAAPSSVGQLYFRLLVAQYARKDTAADLSGGWLGRWQLLRAVWKFSRGRGTIPPLQAAFQPVLFESLEKPFGPLTAEQDELLTRYFLVKVQGLHFCGPAYYDVPFVEGFQSLALMFPVTLWLARWLAVGEGQSQLSTDHIARALAIADHHHGFSPALGQPAARSRVRQLAGSADIPRLILRYSQ